MNKMIMMCVTDMNYFNCHKNNMPHCYENQRKKKKKVISRM